MCSVLVFNFGGWVDLTAPAASSQATAHLSKGGYTRAAVSNKVSVISDVGPVTRGMANPGIGIDARHASGPANEHVCEVHALFYERGGPPTAMWPRPQSK